MHLKEGENRYSVRGKVELNLLAYNSFKICFGYGKRKMAVEID